MNKSSKIYAAIWCIFLLFCGAGTICAQSSAAQYYQKGQNAISQGHPEKALKIWLRAKGNLQTPNTRIGIAFIKVTTEDSLKKYYKYATLMYQWGLSANKVAVNKKALQKEVKRVGILADKKEYHRWQNFLKNDNPKIYQSLRNFWKEYDPTPTTTYNERLIEHWQRLAYARNHYSKHKNSFFDADDRARIYLRLGKPDQIRKGSLQLNAGIAKGEIRQIWIISNPSRTLNKITERRINEFAEIVSSFESYPSYKIWVYYPDKIHKKNLIYIFGNAGYLTGGLKMLNSIEDFIPSEAYLNAQTLFSTYRDQPPKGLNYMSPADLLLYQYYDQLSSLSQYFADLFTSMDDQLFASRRVSPSIARTTNFEARTKLQHLEQHAPRQESSYNQQMANIPVRVNSYRLLNKNNQPYLATFVESKPRKAFFLDYLTNYKQKKKDQPQKQQKKKLNKYRYIQAVQLYDKSGNLKSVARDNPPIELKGNRSSFSFFKIPSVEKGAREVFVARLENADTHSTYAGNQKMPFSNQLRGLGKVVITQPAPMNNDPDKLQMGDLIIGYDYQQQFGGSNHFPFVVANKHKIPKGKQLVLHFELYHLSKNTKGIYHAKLSYQINPKTKGLLKWFKKQKKGKLKVTLNLESRHSRYIENLHIKTHTLKPGRYTMQVVAKEPVVHRQVHRTFKFEVAAGH